MVNPNDIIVTGWDISDLNIYESCKRAQVLEPDLLEQLKEQFDAVIPRTSCCVR